ncbi:MAG: phage holin family protein [Patescibacteria group bacterium]|nr:phage holin family protein [Patescibacteria group bacterium]
MFILRWVVNALAVMLAAYLIPGVSVTNFWAALITALVMGLINAIIRPLVVILTLPVNIITLGLFTLVINALMFWLAAYFVPGFDVNGFWAAFGGALIFWAVSWLTNASLKTRNA